MVDDAETQRKLLQNLWSTMLKHKGSRYTVRGEQKLTQIDYNSRTMSQASTITAT
jgi:hypothetical protein